MIGREKRFAMEDRGQTTRRRFLKSSAVTASGVTLGLHAIGAPTVRPVLGANDRIRMGFIGVGNRGWKLLRSFMSHDNVDIVALNDVYEPYLQRDLSKVDQRLKDALGNKIPPMGENEMFKGRVDRYRDFRELLDRKDIDAVCISTPDHWHAVQTIMACQAGKDVYVEKPLSMTIHEGRRMVEVAKETDRVVQVGINRRGSSIYQEAVEAVRSGKIGRVSVARAYRISNMYPDGIGNARPEDPPEGLDWDMWVGPRAFQPYQYNIAPYKFRWWKAYSSQNGNWGVHYIDAMRWLMDEEAPIKITAHSTKSILTDDRTIPDTSEITYELASGALIVFGMYEAGGGRAIEGGDVELRGTKGNLVISDRGYGITPTKGGQFQNRGMLTELVEKTKEEPEDNMRNTPSEPAANLISNFLDCVKSRKQPLCDLETGHRSNSFSLLANIAEDAGTHIEWDPEKERVVNNGAANDLLHYEYRKPWKLG
jgi:predicted dehydrogenase